MAGSRDDRAGQRSDGASPLCRMSSLAKIKRELCDKRDFPDGEDSLCTSPTRPEAFMHRCMSKRSLVTTARCARRCRWCLKNTCRSTPISIVRFGAGLRT